MTEQDFVNDEVMPQLRKCGHVIHVQNTAESGTPDINYAIFPTSGWIETKVAKSGWLYFETFQIPWFRKRLRALGGGGVFVLAKVGTETCLWKADAILGVDREPYKKWVRCKVDNLPAPLVTLSRQGWAAIIAALTDPSQFTSSQDAL
jgi:hypothetical protein